MRKSTPIKADLFRFVTFRTPESMDQQNKNLRFVTHPDMSKSLIKSCPVPQAGKEGSTSVFTTYLKQFKPFKTYDEVRAVNPSLYDTANTAAKKKSSISDFIAVNSTKPIFLTEKQVVLLYDQLFYQIITKESKVVRQAITQLLIANHALKNAKQLSSMGLLKLQEIKVVIPRQVLDCFKPWAYSQCGGSLNGVQNLGIADFRRVEQEVCCYVPGEVSHIENIMAKEYKERSTRNFVRTENTIETSKETEIENLTDVTTATRNEISSEIANLLEQERSANYGGSLGVSAEYMKAQINVNAYADFATSNSSSYSNTEAKTYAEEVTRRALERIVQKTSEKRTSKIIKEFEESNKHGFDNRNGNKHVTGIYRWLDIIYKNRLVNYGKRLMVEFMVPEPAEFYKRILEYTAPKPTNSTTPTDESLPPKSLKDFGINSHKDITRINYTNLGTEYGVALNAPLAATKIANSAFSPNPPIRHGGPDWTRQGSITIEMDYEAQTVTGNYSFRWRATLAERAHFNYTVGNITGGNTGLRGPEQTTSGNINGVLNPRLTQAIPVTFTGDKLFTYGVNISITCVLSAAKFEEWQLATYNQLMAAYNSKLDDYNLNLAQAEDEDHEHDSEVEKKYVNPAMNRIIEQRELKRICTEMIMKPYCRVQGKKNYTDLNACDLYEIPQVNQTTAFANYASQVKFFEQAIDWQLMSYLFYPYFWADKCDWAELMQSENDDAVFQAFLQSGMARVVVPIRTQFAEAFMFYLETGEIWLGNELLADTEDDLYLSIAEELQTIEGTVEEEWETRVPTSLAIIQGKSAYLDQEGLPCCHEVVSDGTTTGILGSDNILEIIKP